MVNAQLLYLVDRAAQLHINEEIYVYNAPVNGDKSDMK